MLAGRSQGWKSEVRKVDSSSCSAVENQKYLNFQIKKYNVGFRRPKFWRKHCPRGGQGCGLENYLALWIERMCSFNKNENPQKRKWYWRIRYLEFCISRPLFLHCVPLHVHAHLDALHYGKQRLFKYVTRWSHWKPKYPPCFKVQSRLDYGGSSSV